MRERLGGLKIPLDRPVGPLSGGQRAQVALALTLAKRPRLLLLDEPLAALDPLARRNFPAALAEAAAGGNLTIVLSSHLIADIERVCDHLILLAASRVQLCGDTETLLAEHRVLTGPRKDTTAIARTHAIVREDTTARQTTLPRGQQHLGIHLQHPAHSDADRLIRSIPKMILLTYKSDAHPRWPTGQVAHAHASPPNPLAWYRSRGI